MFATQIMEKALLMHPPPPLQNNNNQKKRLCNPRKILLKGKNAAGGGKNFPLRADPVNVIGKQHLHIMSLSIYILWEMCTSPIVLLIVWGFWLNIANIAVNEAVSGWSLVAVN